MIQASVPSVIMPEYPVNASNKVEPGHIAMQVAVLRASPVHHEKRGMSRIAMVVEMAAIVHHSMIM